MNNKMIIYAVLAVGVAIAVIATAWVFTQNNDQTTRSATLDEMKNNLADRNYTTTLATSAQLTDAGAIDGFTFSYSSYGSIHVYEFENEASAKDYAPDPDHYVVLVNGTLAARVHTHGDISAEHKPFFNALLDGKSLPW